MKKILADLIGKKFSVYVGGDFERMTDFIGFMGLLHNWSDFFSYTKTEQCEYLRESVKNKYAYIDSNIYIKIGH